MGDVAIRNSVTKRVTSAQYRTILLRSTPVVLLSMEQQRAARERLAVVRRKRLVADELRGRVGVEWPAGGGSYQG